MEGNLAYDSVEAALAEFSYPLVRDDAAAELADVTVELPDGGVANLGVLVSETDSDAFHGAGDLRAELDAVVDRDGPG
ncbi:hypothetical protein G9C85_12680 [Halorubellus sp. JP-L1]|uniref:DUF5789 family protein n=1 Tax=Halorubellus sp. JP-L1 TaxID=2715753 RepID=UPI00140A4694|nr:hypothetical protein [Halorubellus sp. JP-L1]NHN42474.1 hypothetical protein [Halorubellus sp. JP-L1]